VTNEELIKELKHNIHNLSKEQLSVIIEVAGETYLKNQQFISRQEIAEQTIFDFINELSGRDKESIQKAKQKIIELIP
jgi:hypothetical protein